MEQAQAGERLGWESKVELGEKFFQEIIQHSVPLDLNILKAMKRSSLGIDFYLWLTYRAFTLKRPLRLSWERLYRQFGVKPAQEGDNRTVQAFRTDCLRELKKIKLAWPDLNYATAHGVLILWPSKPSVCARAASARGVFSSLAQNRPITSLVGPPVIRGFASGASESVFHKNPAAGGFSRMKHLTFKRRGLDETPNFGVKFVDETPNHSCS